MLNHCFVLVLLLGPPQQHGPPPLLAGPLEPGGVAGHSRQLEHRRVERHPIPGTQQLVGTLQPLGMEADSQVVVEPLRCQLIPDDFYRAVVETTQPPHLAVKPGAMHL